MENIENEQCPKSYIVLAVISLVINWPLGIPALVNAYKVEKFWYLGNKAEAEKRSKKAKMWSIIALGSMVLSGVLGAIAGIISALRDGVIEFF